MLSEEDKSNIISLSYWFRCVDLDGDGVIRAHEIEEFYTEQIKRVDGLGQQEIIPLGDIVCQLCDLLQTQDDTFRLKNFTKPNIIKKSGIFFDILFDLEKFMAYEMRDPFIVKQQELDGLTYILTIFNRPWNRFAKIEYNRLASEEDGGYEEEQYGDFEYDDNDP